MMRSLIKQKHVLRENVTSILIVLFVLTININGYAQTRDAKKILHVPNSSLLNKNSNKQLPKLLGTNGDRIKDSKNMSLIGSYDPGDAVNDISVSGNYAYVAEGDTGLIVIDIHNPDHPKKVGVYHTLVSDIAWSVNASGKYAYLGFSDGSSGFRIIDVSDPSNPKSIGFVSLTGAGASFSIRISGNYAYVGSGSGLEIIDISDPTNPKRIKQYNTDAPIYGVYVSGDYLYLANTLFGLRVMDISDPTNPKDIYHGDIQSIGYFGVYISKHYAYVADYYNGLDIIDISDPTNPKKIGNLSTNGNPWKVIVSGNYAYLTDQSDGVRIIDVSDPKNPKEVGYYDTGEAAIGISFLGQYICVGDEGSGLFILKNDLINPSQNNDIVFTFSPGGKDFQNFNKINKGVLNNFFTEVTIHNASKNTIDGLKLSASDNNSKMKIYAYNESDNSYSEYNGSSFSLSPNEIMYYILEYDAIENNSLNYISTILTNDKTVDIHKDQSIISRYANKGGSFLLNNDAYNFSNPSFNGNDILIGIIAAQRLSSSLYYTLLMWVSGIGEDGLCYGLAGTSGDYYLNKDDKPYNNSNPSSWDFNDPIIQDNIYDYFMSQINNPPKYGNLNEAMNSSISLLSNGEPFIMGLKGKDFNKNYDLVEVRHAVLCVKMDYYEDSNDAYYYLYDSNYYDGKYKYADYNSKESTLNYSIYHEFNVDRIHRLSGFAYLSNFVNDPIGKLSDKYFTLLVASGGNKNKNQVTQTVNSNINYNISDEDGHKLSNNLNNIVGDSLSVMPISSNASDSLYIFFLPKKNQYNINVNSNINGYISVQTISDGSIASIDSIKVNSGGSLKMNSDSKTINVDSNGDGVVDQKTTLSGVNLPISKNTQYSVPSKFNLNQNYPNPFNPTTNIRYTLPASQHVTITVYNTLGQLVATLIDKDQAAGSYTIHFDAHTLPSGMYIYRLKAGNYTETKKMMLIK